MGDRNDDSKIHKRKTANNSVKIKGCAGITVPNIADSRALGILSTEKTAKRRIRDRIYITVPRLMYGNDGN